MQQATQIARHMVELYGMGGDEVGTASFAAMDPEGKWTHRCVSPAALETADRRIREILEEGSGRASTILRENRALVESLRDMLIEKRVIEAKTLKDMFNVEGRQCNLRGSGATTFTNAGWPTTRTVSS